MCSPVGARTCLCVCVCVCVRIGAELCCARYREQRRIVNAQVETEMTCRHVNKINNIRLFSLFNGIDLF